ncbi:DUF742 domain-containing protein [Streptomyces sp. LBUM 1476]|nr:DUF742 domain-containing protein [Streptomyces sp. LBUM 1476]MBZ3916811.1 DUF742 domain-containing protein [Streptomyces acidiscabies]
MVVSGEQESEFVRTYEVTGGRTRPRRLLALDSVLGPGPAAPAVPAAGLPPVHEQIVALCRLDPRSVAELAGTLRRPAASVKVVVSDLLDDHVLALHTARPYGDDDEAPDVDVLAALLAGLKRKFPDARSLLRAG